MKEITGILLASAAVAVLIQTGARAADMSVGQREYEKNCLVCHGPNANGNGPFSVEMNYDAPSLTRIQKKNGGTFPVEAVYRKIDGRDGVKAHAKSAMPTWASNYIAEIQGNTEPFLGMGPSEEPVVRARILALIDYLSQLQEK